MGPDDLKIPGLTDQLFTGTIKGLSRDPYFGGVVRHGFIHCPELKIVYSRDIYVPAFHIGTLKVGDGVRFRVCTEKSGLKVAEVIPMRADEHVEEAVSTHTSLGRFRGTVTHVDEYCGYGLVRSPELWELMQREVFFCCSWASPKGGSPLGRAVSFEAVLLEHGLVCALAPEASVAAGCDVQELVHLAWSCASLQFSDRPLLDAIAAASRPTMSDFTPQHQASMARALASLVFEHQPLLDAISA